ncbi:MAG TPA: hypothetical protein VFC78_06720 [Tepidisphaeraceae bacterium]|nr:hypothetical protein [Tepidisphaeraceae bacterium]
MNRIVPFILSRTQRFISALLAQLALCLVVAPMLVAQKAQAQREHDAARQSAPQPSNRSAVEADLDTVNLRSEEVGDAGQKNGKRRHRSGRRAQGPQAKDPGRVFVILQDFVTPVDRRSPGWGRHSCLPSDRSRVSCAQGRVVGIPAARNSSTAMVFGFESVRGAGMPPLADSRQTGMSAPPVPTPAIARHSIVLRSIPGGASGFTADEVRCLVARLRDGNPATQPAGPPAC